MYISYGAVLLSVSFMRKEVKLAPVFVLVLRGLRLEETPVLQLTNVYFSFSLF